MKLYNMIHCSLHAEKQGCRKDVGHKIWGEERYSFFCKYSLPPLFSVLKQNKLLCCWHGQKESIEK